MLELTPANVEDIFISSLHNKEESAAEHPITEGVMIKVRFCQGKLERNRDQVIELLSQLPEVFSEDKGGGMSFLQACENNQGAQWTGEHRIMDLLFTLGLGLGLVSFCLPREMWDSLPGSMPYISINLKQVA